MNSNEKAREYLATLLIGQKDAALWFGAEKAALHNAVIEKAIDALDRIDKATLSGMKLNGYTRPNRFALLLKGDELMKGAFDIAQDEHGGVRLHLLDKSTLLSPKQIEELGLRLRTLRNFDATKYLDFWKSRQVRVIETRFNHATID